MKNLPLPPPLPLPRLLEQSGSPDSIGSPRPRFCVFAELSDGTTTLAATVVDQLDRLGLEFFEQFQHYSDVLCYYKEHGDLPFQTPELASLEAVLVAHHMGDEQLSASLFSKAFNADHGPFQAHVAELARRVGGTVG